MALNLVTGYAGEEHVTAIQDALLNRASFDEGTYVTDYGDKFAGAIITNNEITIGSGCMIIQGREVVQEGTQNISIESGTIGQKRIDLVCAHYDKSPDTGVESFNWEVLTGTEAPSPEEPTVIIGDLFDITTLTHYEPMFRVDVDETGTISLTKLFEEKSTLKKEIDQHSEKLDGIDSDIEEIKGNLTELETEVSGKADKSYFTLGKFSVNTIANTAVEIKASSLTSGTLPPISNNVWFSIVGQSSKLTHHTQIEYDGGKLYVYSDISQSVTFRWLYIADF